MRKLLLSLLLIFLSPLSLRAWGTDGHRAIGKIAEQHLSRRAKSKVQQLLSTETIP